MQKSVRYHKGGGALKEAGPSLFELTGLMVFAPDFISAERKKNERIELCQNQGGQMQSMILLRAADGA